MAGTTKKVVTFGDPIATKPAMDPLRSKRSVEWVHHRNVGAAQDTVCGANRRVVASLGLLAENQYPVPDTVGTSTATQDGPEADVFRFLARPRIRMTPGNYLAASIVYIPSGMTQVFGAPDWFHSGARARLRFTIDFTNDEESASNTNLTWIADLKGSNRVDGAPPVPPYGSILVEDIVLMHPDDLFNDVAIMSDFSEFTHADVEIEGAGGYRFIDIVLYEVPVAHGQEESTPNLQSCHAFTVGTDIPLNPQSKGPQTDAADGTHGFDEQRFGSTQILSVAKSQNTRLGPLVFSWSAWDPDPTDVTTTTQPFVTTGSATLVCVNNPAHTAWQNDHPGYMVDGGAQHLPWEQNDIIYAADGGRAWIPVTIEAFVRVTNVAEIGLVRVQSSDDEFVEMLFSNATFDWVTAHGWLETQAKGDARNVANAMIFMAATTAVHDVEVSQVNAYYGHFKSGP